MSEFKDHKARQEAAKHGDVKIGHFVIGAKWQHSQLQSQLQQLETKLKDYEGALENIASTKKSDLMDNPAYWGEMIVGCALEALKGDPIK